MASSRKEFTEREKSEYKCTSQDAPKFIPLSCLLLVQFKIVCVVSNYAIRKPLFLH